MPTPGTQNESGGNINNWAINICPNLRVAENELGFQEFCRIKAKYRKCNKNDQKVQAGRKHRGEGKLLTRKGNRLGCSEEREREHVGKGQTTNQL